MNRTAVHLFALALLAIPGCRASNAAQSLNALRNIKVERHTMLMLGAQMPLATDFCDWSEATCTFKTGTFGGAKGMSLTKTKSGAISQFHFDYGAISTDAVKAQIEDYTQSLGKPLKDSTTKEGDFNLRELEWSDSATTFKLFYKTSPAQVEASALLFDNALAAPAH
jgi:hypothetical protein